MAAEHPHPPPRYAKAGGLTGEKRAHFLEHLKFQAKQKNLGEDAQEKLSGDDPFIDDLVSQVCCPCARVLDRVVSVMRLRLRRTLRIGPPNTRRYVVVSASEKRNTVTRPWSILRGRLTDQRCLALSQWGCSVAVNAKGAWCGRRALRS